MNDRVHFNITRGIFTLLVVIGFSSIWGCTDAERSKYFSVGSEHTVRCFSGGTLIYEGVSTGKVLSEESSDGYYFTDKVSGKLMEVSGNCVITIK